jgi:cell division protease FtsH
MEKETLDKAEVEEVFAPLRRRPVRPAWTGSPDRAPSTIPPVEFIKKVEEAQAEAEAEEAGSPAPDHAAGNGRPVGDPVSEGASE